MDFFLFHTSVPTFLNRSLICQSNIMSDNAKATHFNKFFVSSSAIDESSAWLPTNVECKVKIFNSIEVQETEVFDQIKFLYCNKSYDPDRVSPKFIKMSGQSLVRPISKQYVDNYCPVLLLCILHL